MLPIVHVANDLAHYTANFGPLRPGDLLLLIDTIEKMTTRMRIDLKTIPTVDQRRAVITQVVQVCLFFHFFITNSPIIFKISSQYKDFEKTSKRHQFLMTFPFVFRFLSSET